MIGIVAHILRRLLFPNPTIVRVVAIEDIDFLLPENFEVAEPESKACSIVEKQKLEEYRARVAR
jgi:hypothetical protein